MIIKNLSKQYDGKTVVDDVTFHIPKGKVISMIGPNGAGKSTVMGIISRLIARDSGMVDFGGNTHEALIALCAALFSIVVYSVGAARFGIPTSESHALIAGLSGAAIALHGGLLGINGGEWVKVLYGLVLSTLLGFALGWLCTKAIEFLFVSWSPGPAGIWTGAGPQGFSGTHRSPVRRPWPLCTAHRTGRSSWASSCWASFWPAARGTRRAFRSPSG